MERTGKLIRRSIFTFLQNYQYFTTTSVFFILPFSASILLSQALFSSFSALPPFIHAPFISLFHAAGFSPSSHFVSLLNLNLSQTIFTSVVCLPFTLSSLLIAKASIIQTLQHHRTSLTPPFSSFKSLYKPFLLTQLCNLLLTITFNIAAFSLLFIAFNFFKAVGFSLNNPLSPLVAGAVFSFLANAVVICNLALVVAGMENCTGYSAIRKAYLLRRGRNSMALLLALPVNLGLAAIEALFRYRLVRAYQLLGSPGLPFMAIEGLFIAYLHSLLIVLDTIISCLFFKSCESNFRTNQAGRFYYQIELVEEEDNSTSTNSKTLEELP